MAKKVILTAQAPAPVGPYSQAIAAGNLVFLAGQIPLHPNTGEMVGAGDVGQQTEQVIKNIAAILEASGASLADVVKTTVFLSDMNNFAAMNAVYSQHFAAEIAPARSTIEVSRLPKDALVEIECIALLPEK